MSDRLELGLRERPDPEPYLRRKRGERRIARDDGLVALTLRALEREHSVIGEDARVHATGRAQRNGAREDAEPGRTVLYRHHFHPFGQVCESSPHDAHAARRDRAAEVNRGDFTVKPRPAPSAVSDSSLTGLRKSS